MRTLLAISVAVLLAGCGGDGQGGDGPLGGDGGSDGAAARDLARAGDAAGDGPAPSGGDWPTFLHDPQRTSANAGETAIGKANAAALHPLWTLASGDVVAASATVVGGTVYIGSWDGNEYALDAATGAVKWMTPLGTTTTPAGCNAPYPSTMGITSSAAVVGGTLYVGGGDSGWYALDAATGKVQWMVSAIPAGQQPDGYYNYASPLILGNFAYVGIASSGNCPSTVGALLRVDLTQHAVVGEWDPLPAGQVGGPIWSSPAADPSGATLYVATGEGDAGDYTTQPYTLAIVALDATTLAVTGSFQIPQSDFVTDPDFGASPSVFDDSNGRHLVACANKDGWIYALDRTTMQLAWKVHLDAGGGDPITGEGSISSAAVAGSMVYVGAGSSSVMGQSFEGAVTAIDAATGKVAWAHGAPGVVMGPITFANGLVFYGTGSTSNGVSAAVEVLDAASGNALFTAMLGPPAAANFVSSSVTVSGGRLFFGHGNGTIYAYGL